MKIPLACLWTGLIMIAVAIPGSSQEIQKLDPALDQIVPANARLERVANVTWGDKDAKTLYITASTSIYRIRLKIPGVRN